jgi:hypothetical protein
VVGISRVEPSISALRSSRESPRTSMPQRSASPSNSDKSTRPQVAVSKSPKRAARSTVVDVDPSLGSHHADLASPIQVTPITG